MLPTHAGEVTQDFVLDTGKVFNALGAKTFLSQISPVEAIAPKTPQAVKGAVSAVALATNKALHAVGADSAALDFFGHPFLHSLGEPYYSQVPFRYGDYIAKLSVLPDTTALASLKAEKFKPEDYDGLRTEVVEFFRSNPAEFVVGIQLCTSLERMPVENANAEWSEDESLYQPVARIVHPAQDAYGPARRTAVDEQYCSAPRTASWHTGPWGPACVPGWRRMRGSARFGVRRTASPHASSEASTRCREAPSLALPAGPSERQLEFEGLERSRRAPAALRRRTGRGASPPAESRKMSRVRTSGFTLSGRRLKWTPY